MVLVRRRLLEHWTAGATAGAWWRRLMVTASRANLMTAAKGRDDTTGHGREQRIWTRDECRFGLWQAAQHLRPRTRDYSCSCRARANELALGRAQEHAAHAWPMSGLGSRSSCAVCLKGKETERTYLLTV